MSDLQQQPAKVKMQLSNNFDVIIVGAGLAGLYMLHRLRRSGLSARIFEAGSGVGGTWYWNRYPGARCDIDSMEYSYSFSDELQQEWNWTERYASQPEILQYINHVADRFDLRRDIQLDTRVTSAIFDEAANCWKIQTDKGDHLSAKFCIMATGCLSAAQVPAFPGLETFEGKSYHTAHWPHEGVDFTGQRVGVIGTGSSGIQSIPIIAQQADHLFIFQRTPGFSVPARNGPLDPAYVQWLKANYAEHRHKARQSIAGLFITYGEKAALEVEPTERQQAYETRWERGGISFLTVFKDLLTSKEANATAAEFFHSKIRAVVHNQAVAEALLPKDYAIGTKRLCADTNYYETFNRDNVTLVDLRHSPIEMIIPQGVKTSAACYELDSLVFATGFDAMTGALLNIDIRGKDGLTLKQKWAEGPRSYLGLMTAGFPNFFIITGPGSPSVLSNMIVSIEQHVDWIADCLDYLNENELESIEASLEAEDRWVTHVSEEANLTLSPSANSWYLGANIPGKPRIFMPYTGGVGVYRRKCDAVAANGYEGFILA